VLYSYTYIYFAANSTAVYGYDIAVHFVKQHPTDYVAKGGEGLFYSKEGRVGLAALVLVFQGGRALKALIDTLTSYR
jgi:hypothetical protein